jgi:hypothetical protein
MCLFENQPKILKEYVAFNFRIEERTKQETNMKQAASRTTDFQRAT